MYRVGLGDCFLLSLPTGAEMEHILIDCGTHPKGDIGKLEAAVENIAMETGGKLALVIATHAHADHLSGFGAYQDTFRQFQVGEVWLPWTENSGDRQAAALKAKHTAFVHALVRYFAARQPPEEAEARLDHLQATAALENLRGNDAALSVLKSGINNGTARYMEAGLRIDPAAGIPGLSAIILGPPRDDDFLAQMNPPANERFLQYGEDGSLKDPLEIRPFDDSWTVEASTNPYYAAINEKEKNLLAVAATSAQLLAFKLDQITNNTSVVVLFKFAGKHLLFAGDAQFGNWKNWVDTEDGQAMLAQVCFYKVAHHGSYNATPKSALNAMTQGAFAAMVSTQSKPFPSIPLPDLITAIGDKASGAVRSDSIHVEGAPDGPALTQLPVNFERGDFWFDYYIQV